MRTIAVAVLSCFVVASACQMPPSGMDELLAEFAASDAKFDAEMAKLDAEMAKLDAEKAKLAAKREARKQELAAAAEKAEREKDPLAMLTTNRAQQSIKQHEYNWAGGPYKGLFPVPSLDWTVHDRASNYPDGAYLEASDAMSRAVLAGELVTKEVFDRRSETFVVKAKVMVHRIETCDIPHIRATLVRFLKELKALHAEEDGNAYLSNSLQVQIRCGYSDALEAISDTRRADELVTEEQVERLRESAKRGVELWEPLPGPVPPTLSDLAPLLKEIQEHNAKVRSKPLGPGAPLRESPQDSKKNGFFLRVECLELVG